MRHIKKLRQASTILFSILISGSSFAQSLSRSVYGTLGGTTTVTGGPTLMYNMGETFTATLSGGGYTLNQGFEQGLDTLLPITGASAFCVGSKDTLSDLQPGGFWNSNNTGVATVDSNGVVTGVAAGIDTISYSFSGMIAIATITVNPLPNAATISGSTSVCTGSSITLTDSISGGTWSASNSNATVSAGIVTGVSTGTDTISYTVTNACGSATATQVITVNTVPAMPAAIVGSTTICNGATATYSDATSGGEWDSGNASVLTMNSSGVATTHSVGTAPIYYVLYNSCGYTYDSIIVSVNGAPATPAAISGTAGVCPGTNTTLTDATSGGTWTSSNGNATVSGGVVTGVSAGTANISYTVTNTCGSSYAVKTVTINALPSAGSISGTASVCVGNNTTFSDGTSGGTWSATNSMAYVAGGIVTGISAGIDTITYSVTNSCGTAMATAVVTISGPASVGAITGVTSVCEGGTLTVCDSTSGGVWSSSNSGVAAFIAPGVVSCLAGGSATLSYSVAGACGTAVSTANITVTSLPATPDLIVGALTVCTGSATTLTNAVAGGNWSSDNTVVATIDSTGNFSGLSAGQADITYTISNSCASYYATVTVTVNPLPPVPASITGSSLVCNGGTGTLSESTPGGSWSSSAPSVVTVDTNGILNGITTGTGTITYTMSNSCGSYATGKSVTVIIPPSVPSAISAPTVSVCGGGTLSLTDVTTGGNWSSGNPALATIGSSNGILTGVAGGVVTITYSVANSCGSSIATRNITVNPPAAIVGSGEVCNGSKITLTDVTGSGTWSSSNTSVASVSSGGIVLGVSVGAVNISYTKSGCYVVQPVTVNANTLDSIRGANNVCIGNTATLTNTGTGYWRSANAAIVTVDSATGVIHGITAGNALITFNANTGCFVKTSAYVGAPPGPITGNDSVCSGNAITTLSATIAGGSWVSSNTAIAAIAGTGVVTGRVAGLVTITYTKTGCVVTTPFKVFINPLPGNTGPTAVCSGSTATLSNAMPGGIWSVNNTALATVGSTTGIVTSVTYGAPFIYYTLPSGCFRYTGMTFGAPITTPVTGALSVCSAGVTTTLSDATAGGSWSASPATIATIVSSTGVAQGLAPGNATITYTKWGCYTTGTLTVNPNNLDSIRGNTYVCLGSTSTLTNTASGTWSSANSAVAAIDGISGVLTGESSGSSRITFTGSAGCLRVTSAYIGTPIAAITGYDTVCAGGGHSTLADTTSGGTWGTSNSAVATVNSGIVSGAAAGSATISYSRWGCNATTPIYVMANPLAAITGAAAVCNGSTVTFGDATPGGTWTSSNTGVAAIGSATGVTNIVSPGTATIQYSGATGGCYKTMSITARTAPSAISGAHAICTSSPVTLTDATSGGTWTSSNVGRATVGAANGRVVGVAGGAVTITYSITGCTVATYAVTVTVCREGAIASSSTDAASTQAYTLYPNPTTGAVHISQLVATDGLVPVRVTNYIGQEVYRADLLFSGGSTEFTLSNAIPGLYLVVIEDGADKAIFKLLVEK